MRLGRDLTPTFTGYADYDVFGTNGVADASKFASSLGTNRDTAIRADNMVSYFTPDNLGGFYGPRVGGGGRRHCRQEVRGRSRWLCSRPARRVAGLRPDHGDARLERRRQV